MANKVSEDVKHKMALANHRIDQIYDFVCGPNPDMTRKQFRKEFKALADPNRMRMDMESIALQKQIQQQGMMLN